MKKIILIALSLLIFFLGIFSLIQNVNEKNENNNVPQINKDKIVQKPKNKKQIKTDLPKVEKPHTNNNDFIILNQSISKGTKKNIKLVLVEGYTGSNIEIPVTIIHGLKAGPVVCMTGGVHGDELNGILIVKEVLKKIKAKKLKGTIIGVPIVNLPAFRRGNRYLPDHNDLNRFFPGSLKGALAARMAYQLFNQVIKKCDCLVDFHTGSLRKNNFPQIRADLSQEKVKNLALHFATPVVIHNKGPKKTLRRVAVEHNIPAIVFETGLPLRLQIKNIKQGVKGMMNLLVHLKLTTSKKKWQQTNIVYHKTRWLRTDHGGILINKTKLGAFVKKNELLAVVIDPLSDKKKHIKSKFQGHIIGQSISKLVMPGYAIFHIGTKKTILAQGTNIFEEENMESDLEIEDLAD